MNPTKVLVYSCGGNGREIAWLVQDQYAESGGLKIAFVEDNEDMIGREINGIPVISYAQAKDQHADWLIANAIGNPITRQKTTEKCLSDGFRFHTSIHPGAAFSEFNSFGDGCILCAGTIITVNVTIGRNCNFNRSVNIGHDCVIGDYISIAPGANIGGWVDIGERVYVGTGASIINGTRDKPLKIGNDAIIGAGACVIRDVEANAVVGGVPAKVLKMRDDIG